MAWQPIRYFRRAWLTACKAAGAPHRIPHDFRRTAVRNLERAGVPRSATMKMVGHKTEAMYRRYAIADESMLREGAPKTCRPCRGRTSNFDRRAAEAPFASYTRKRTAGGPREFQQGRAADPDGDDDCRADRFASRCARRRSRPHSGDLQCRLSRGRGGWRHPRPERTDHAHSGGRRGHRRVDGAGLVLAGGSPHRGAREKDVLGVLEVTGAGQPRIFQNAGRGTDRTGGH